MKITKSKILGFICVTIIYITILFPHIVKVYATESYTSINSQTLLEKNSLDTLSLNYTTLPTITVSGSETYNIKDEGSIIDSTVSVRKVEFPKATTGKTLDSVISVKYNQCGKLNGKLIDMKLVYSDIVTKGNSPFLHWTAYGKAVSTNNEWWYRNIEHMTINIYFYNSGTSTPITFNTAYLSLFSEDRNEGASSKTSSNQYLYEKTDMTYTSSFSSQHISRNYKNIFYGTVGATVDGNTNAGTLKCVSFQYQKTNYLEIELYALNNKLDIGYHLQYNSLTASIPENPQKTVDKIEVDKGDNITYTVTQNISKATDKNFYYSSLVFQDVLNTDLIYYSLTVYDEKNKDITSTAGTTTYDATTNKVNYNFSTNYLKNINYQGQNYKFVIKAKVKNDAKQANITNSSSTIINDKYTISSNTVTSKLYYKVIVHHVDEEGKTLANSETIIGHKGDSYTTKAKNIKGYQLIQTPANNIGTMTQDITIVTYRYRLKDTKVIAKYVDEQGKEIEKQETIEGKVFDQYTTFAKNIYGYELIETPANEKGTMTEEPITVIYRYRLKNTKVIAKYVDEQEKEIEKQETIEGKVFDQYTTSAKNIYGYELVETPSNEEGIMTEEPITVIYRYQLKNTKVIAKYVDEQGKEIEKQETIEGKVFDQYTTSAKNIYGYELIETPSNKEGIMTEEPITVMYRYQLKDSSIVVKYIDEEGKEIEKQEIIQGKVFDEYMTKNKEIEGYKLIEEPLNKKGRITENPITVIYPYTKLKFNISVSQQLAKIILNSEIKQPCEKLEINKKVEVHSLKLFYTITVSNQSELDGSTILYYDIPNGYKALKEENSDWTIDGKVAYREINNLVIGEARDFTIVLTAISKEVTGTTVNVASCRESTCKPGFEETTLIDNIDTKEFIISISTGLIGHTIEIVLGILIALTILGFILYRFKHNSSI